MYSELSKSNKFTEFSLDDVVASQRNTTTTGLGETTLVDQVANALEVGVTPGNVRLANAEHIEGSLKKNEFYMSSLILNE